MAKCILKVAVQQEKEDFGKRQLFRGVEAVIEGVIRFIRLLWAQYAHEEDWGFLFIDACNTFNKKNWTGIM